LERGIAMSSDKHVEWDVHIPEKYRTGREGRSKLVVSGLILAALVAGPLVLFDGRDSEDKQARSGNEAAVSVSSRTPESETPVQADAAASDVDTAGVQYERYFPGRQAM